MPKHAEASNREMSCMSLLQKYIQVKDILLYFIPPGGLSPQLVLTVIYNLCVLNGHTLFSNGYVIPFSQFFYFFIFISGPPPPPSRQSAAGALMTLSEP